MKKRILAVAVMLCLVMTLTACDKSYEEAYEKTEKLKNYDMQIVTYVTIDDTSVTQTVVTQDILAKGVGTDNMTYSVSTKSEYVDDSGETQTKDDEYTYYDGNYYITMPNVKYYSPIDYENALKNIKNITNIISLPIDKMYNLETYSEHGETNYEYVPDGVDFSEHITTLLQSAANRYDGVAFSPQSISASAIVDGRFVKERSFYAMYSSADADITLEVYVTLNKRKAKVDIPDMGEYQSVQ